MRIERIHYKNKIKAISPKILNTDAIFHVNKCEKIAIAQLAATQMNIQIEKCLYNTKMLLGKLSILKNISNAN